MRRLAVPVLLLALLAPVACSAGDGPSIIGSDPVADGDDGADGGPLDGGAAAAPPACPFSAADISALVGRKLVDEGKCSFGDGKGVASLSITTASKLAGEATYDYQRQQADPQYDRVIDLEAGDRAYLAAKDIRAEAVLISDQGAYTVTMSSFSFDLDRYERTLRAILDKILA